MDRIFKCKYCPRSFTKESDLVAHHRSHIGETAGQSTNPNLSEPEQTTSYYKHFKCEICQRIFIDEWLLRAHINRVHSAEKLFTCGTCDQSFGTANTLKSHMATHVDTQNFRCKFCEKCFSLKSERDTHLNIHNEEYPYKCIQCQKGFKYKAVVTKHTKFCIRMAQRKKPPKRRHKCEICQHAFTRRIHVDKHIEACHVKVQRDFLERSFANQTKGQSSETNSEQTPDPNVQPNSRPGVFRPGVKAELPPNMFECHVCQERFTDQKQYDIHAINHVIEDESSQLDF